MTRGEVGSGSGSAGVANSQDRHAPNISDVFRSSSVGMYL